MHGKPKSAASEPKTARAATGYLPHVDGLRALAVLAVIAYHALPRYAPAGFLGVDVFFVISGFLITSIIAREMAEKRFTLSGFFARRVRRIMPALVCVYLATFIAAVLLLPPDAMIEYGRSLMASAAFLANVYFYKTTDYFALPAHEKPLLHTWSLAVEEQYYILWPLLLLALTRWLPGRAGVVLLTALGAALLLYSRTNALNFPAYAFYNLLPRAWQLLLGALLALTITGIRLPRTGAELLAAAGLAAILGSVFLLDETMPFPGFAALPATLGAAALILAGQQHPTGATRLLSLRPVIGTGLISYSLYLWHWPLLVFARIGAPDMYNGPAIGALVAGSFGLAWLSWRFVERPFRTAGGTLFAPSRSTILCGLSALCAVAFAGFAIDAGEGWAWRLDAPAAQVYAERNSANPFRQGCDGNEKVFGHDEECTFGRPKPANGSFDIAIFGDSNADQFVPLFAGHAERAGLSGRQVTQSTCAPLLGAWRFEQPEWRERACRRYQELVLEFLDANPELRLAVLAANWTSYDNPKKLGHNGLALAGTNAARPRSRAPQRLESLLETTVRQFTRRGVSVLIIGQIPYRDDALLACAIAARRGGESGPACGAAAAGIRDGLAVSNNAILQVARRFPNVSARLPSDVMCGPGQCHAVMDGIFLYANAGHLNAAGARHLSRYIRLPDVPARGTLPPETGPERRARPPGR